MKKRNTVLEKMVIHNSQFFITHLPNDVVTKNLFIYLYFLEYFHLRRINRLYYRYFTEILNSLQFKPYFLWFQDEYDRKKIFDDYEEELKKKLVQISVSDKMFGKNYIESRFKVEIFYQLIDNRNRILLSRIPTLFNGPLNGYYELKPEERKAIQILTAIINPSQDGSSLVPSRSEVQEAITTLNTFYTRQLSSWFNDNHTEKFIALIDKKDPNPIWMRTPADARVFNRLLACLFILATILLFFTGLFFGDASHNSEIFSLSSKTEKILASIFLFLGICCCCPSLSNYIASEEGKVNIVILSAEAAKTQLRLNAILTLFASKLPTPALTADSEVNLDSDVKISIYEEKKEVKGYRLYKFLSGFSCVNGNSKNQGDSLKTSLLLKDKNSNDFDFPH